jgi:hypothetical protein
MNLDWTSAGSISALSADTTFSGSRKEGVLFEAKLGRDGYVEVREAFPSEPELEREYQRIGRWLGPDASVDARRGIHTFWAGLGEAGSEWLIERLARETNVDALDGVANLLASLRVVSLSAILRALGDKLAADQELALLQALAAMPPSSSADSARKIERELRERVCAHDADLAEGATRATRALSRDRALALLERAKTAAIDSALRAAIEYEIEERRT